MVNFKDRLKEAMSMCRVTQMDLCEKTGIPKSAMSQYVSGAFKPKRERADIIAKALNVSVAWLMGYTDDPINYDDDDLIADIPEEIVRHFNGDIKKAYKAWQARTNPQINEEILVRDNASNVQYSFDEKELLTDYRSLNDLGKQEARKRVNELTKLEQYKSSDNSEEEIFIPIAARNARTDDLKLKRNPNISILDLPDYKGGRK